MIFLEVVNLPHDSFNKLPISDEFLNLLFELMLVRGIVSCLLI